MLPVSVPATLNGVAGTLSGTVPGFSSSSGHVLADLSFTRFTSNNGTVTNLPHAIDRSLPVTNAANANVCRILNLRLGPLHLNLLGLVVNLNRVHLTITAVRGPGNLLGNLLCAVAHLLDGSAPAASKARLLNDVVGTLGILAEGFVLVTPTQQCICCGTPREHQAESDVRLWWSRDERRRFCRR
jgi:hypothetical protein